MAKLKLPNGMIALVDDEDFAFVNERKWFAHKTGDKTYVVSKAMFEGKQTRTFLHRMILDCDRERVGFKNGNPLDCRRENLEVRGHSAPAKTYARGSLGEAIVIADLARHGHDIFVPIAGHTAADLISVKGASKPIRWQVKFRTRNKGSSSLSISLSAVQPTKGGYIRRRYELDAIDGFAICCSETESVYYIPISHIDTKKTSFAICLGENENYPNSKNGQNYTNPDVCVTPNVTVLC